MKASEMREKSAEDLLALREQTQQELFNLRMQKATGQLSQNHQFKQLRADIARINTLLNEQQ